MSFASSSVLVDDSPRFECPMGTVSQRFCMDSFVMTNDAKIPEHPCWECRLGARKRLVYGWGLPPLKVHVDDIINLCHRNDTAAEARLVKACGYGEEE